MTFHAKTSSQPPVLAFVILWFTGLYLRLPILVVAPLTAAINQDLNLPQALLGSLTTLPVLMLSVGAILGSLVIVHLGARNTLAILGVIFFAANLRAPLTSVGPVIGEISLSLSLSKTAAGMLTTIPLLAFGLLSSFIPRISQRFGMELVLLLSLVLLGVGLSVRSLGSITTLFIGAALVGTAITFGNVLMPAFIKTRFPKRIGVMMGVYSVGMNLTAALAAGLSIGIGK